jgi:hypothetical protein
VPEFRRQGHATEILRQALPIAREKAGIRRVLENVISGPDLATPKRRYWIDLL